MCIRERQSGIEKMNSCQVSGVGLDFPFCYQLLKIVIDGFALLKIRNVYLLHYKSDSSAKDFTRSVFQRI